MNDPEDHTMPDSTTMMSEQLMMLDALYEIAMSTTDADTVRQAMLPLTGTAAGRAYLTAHPIIL